MAMIPSRNLTSHTYNPAVAEEIAQLIANQYGKDLQSLQQELHRRAKPMGPAVKTTHEASALPQALCQQPGVSLAIPAIAGWDVFHQLMLEGDLSVRLCTDSYLATLAISNGWRLVSFDRDFERFGDLHQLSLGSAG